ncbi:MAG: 6-phosphogluconolactonase [Gemmatimonadota bacterium]
MNPTVIVVAPDSFAETAATAIADFVNSTIASQGACSVALCGGTTPAPVYRALTHHSVDWSKVSIWFGDERAVPPISPDSNFAMACASLMDFVAIPGVRIHRMPAERPDIDSAAQEYGETLPPSFDLLLLGMGPDGHTASLFPGSPALSERERRVVAVPSPTPPLQPQVARMTITPVVIEAARHVIVMVRGSDKAAILRQVLDGPEQPVMLPAQLARGGTWIVDRAAGAQLQARNS